MTEAIIESHRSAPSCVLAGSAAAILRRAFHQGAEVTMSNVYDFSAKTIDGEERKLDAYRGKTLLIVNVASRCGMTPQYEGLEAMYRKYKDQGLEVLGFPCNQFGQQEPGSEEDIKQFCTTRYEVTFPMFAKVDVNGDGAHPLYQHLKKEDQTGAKPIAWNFTKFLVDKAGKVLKRFAPSDKPETIDKDVKNAL
jgi:glutathione peroxidase